jgi:Zn ribbon nucleic-acid-binding protein
MDCPKCKAKIGVMNHEVILDFTVVQGTRCVICGYWSQPYPLHKGKHKVGQSEAVL